MYSLIMMKVRQKNQSVEYLDKNRPKTKVHSIVMKTRAKTKVMK